MCRSVHAAKSAFSCFYLPATLADRFPPYLQPTGGEPSSPVSPPSPFAGLAAAAAAGPAGGGTPGLAEALLRRMERSIVATESSIDQLKVGCLDQLASLHSVLGSLTRAYVDMSRSMLQSHPGSPLTLVHLGTCCAGRAGRGPCPAAAAGKPARGPAAAAGAGSAAAGRAAGRVRWWSLRCHRCRRGCRPGQPLTGAAGHANRGGHIQPGVQPRSRGSRAAPTGKAGGWEGLPGHWGMVAVNKGGRGMHLVVARGASCSMGESITFQPWLLPLFCAAGGPARAAGGCRAGAHGAAAGGGAAAGPRSAAGEAEMWWTEVRCIVARHNTGSLQTAAFSWCGASFVSDLHFAGAGPHCCCHATRCVAPALWPGKQHAACD